MFYIIGGEKMVLFIGVETRGYRLTAYSRSGESAILFDQYYPLDIDMLSLIHI